MNWCAILLLFFNFFIIHVIHGQIDDYEVTNFSVEDGLPSNECHDIVQDSLGYIWIATDRGLSRFDGYGFKNYGKKEGLGDLSCLELYLDRHNNIWISTMGKKIYKYISQLDTIIPYKYNYLLEPHHSKSNFNFMNYLDKNEIAYFGIDGTGIVKITRDGKVILPDTFTIQPNQFYSFEVEDKFMLGISRINKKENKVKLKIGFTHEFTTINHKGNVYPNHYNLNQKIFGLHRAFKYLDSNFIYLVHGYKYYFQGKNLKKSKPGNVINDILELENGQLLTAEIFRQGVKSYTNNQDFMDNKSLPLMNNISASRILKDHQNNIFISTLEDGFFYLKKKNIKPVDLAQFSGSVVTKFVKKNEDIFFLLIDEKSVVQKNIRNNTIMPVYKSESNILDILFERNLSELYIGGQSSWILTNDRLKKKQEGFCGKEFRSITAILKYVQTKNRIITLSHDKFSIYSDMNKPPDFCSEGVFPRKRFISGSEYKDNTYLLGALDGLFIQKSNTLVKSDSIHPLFRSRINDIKTFNGKYLLGTLGNGLGIWDGEKNISMIQKTDGILTDNIERIYVDDSRNIYLCTKIGLSKITFTSDNQYKIKNYTRHHGLPSNIVNDVLQMGDSLYIATAKGLCVLTTDLQYKNEVIDPIIEQMMVNNRGFNLVDLPNSLHHNENNITFHYKSLDHSLSGDIMYRTRLNNNEWVESKSTSINYASLEPGQYTFQVQANNKDLVWSPVVEHVFEIKKPWWQTTLFRLSGFIFIGFLGYTMYRTRIRQFQKENKIQKELIALERSALQAQMNPHFIFNCLNSIQNYIMRNDKDMAMDYLGRFATLIRQYLHASTKDLVTLDDEISMLTNYLHLEQMRFNQSFEYLFQVDNNIDITEITLPPLLIQPFVENAILHGMTSITNGGQINIHISKKENQLQITIKDNGKGFDKNKNSGMRRSLGISITQKRLQYINDHAEGNYAISTKSDESGTEINITVKLT